MNAPVTHILDGPNRLRVSSQTTSARVSSQSNRLRVEAKLGEAVAAPPGKAYEFAEEKRMWVIEHDFEGRPSVSVTNSAGTEMMSTVHHTAGTVTVTHKDPRTGFVYLT